MFYQRVKAIASHRPRWVFRAFCLCHCRRDFWFLALFPGVEFGFLDGQYYQDFSLNLTWLFFDFECHVYRGKTPPGNDPFFFPASKSFIVRRFDL